MNQSQWPGTSSQQQQIISYPQKLPRVPDWRCLAKPSPAGRGQLPNVHLQPDVGGDGVGGGGGGGVGSVGGVVDSILFYSILCRRYLGRNGDVDILVPPYAGAGQASGLWPQSSCCPSLTPALHPETTCTRGERKRDSFGRNRGAHGVASAAIPLNGKKCELKSKG